MCKGKANIGYIGEVFSIIFVAPDPKFLILNKLKIPPVQQFLNRLFARLMKSWSWVVLIVLTIGVKWASWYPDWVEANYSRGVYPVVGRVQRLLFGWIPISVGDLFYGFLILVVLFKTFRFFQYLFRRKLTRQYFLAGLQQFIFFILFVYVFFNLLWGLNYNRRGIAGQLGLHMKAYSLADLDTLTATLQQRINEFAALSTESARDSFDRKRELFSHATEAYKAAEQQYPFLQYRPRSVKPSLYSYLGNYFGFQGYYNPFSGEGQVNTTIPRFLEPYVTTHEIAHQVGYARENEANFVGFLACRAYDNPVYRYSAYFDTYFYTIGELANRDSILAKRYTDSLHPQVKKDYRTLKAFYRSYRNPIEPIIMWGYSQFLKANNQPSGKKTYNEVVGYLVAYGKRYGWDSL